jgi:STE24 endopeptidase
MNKLLLIVYVILVFDFILERILSILNSAKRKRPLPSELEGVYDQDTYQKSQKYKLEYENFGLISSSFSFILVFCVLIFHGFAYADKISRTISENPILLALVFFGILILISDILSTPFDLYGTFKIEEKYGFNKITPKIYITDKIKSYILGIIIGGGLLSLFIWFYYKVGNDFWIYIWVLFTAFSVFMSMFYSNLIVPLFNKQTPLHEGELRQAIIDFVTKAGFKLKNIYIIDGSKRSTKSNAYFTGLGPKKRIVLYDTILNQLSTNEIVAVLAHEIGHYKKKHTAIGMIISVIQMGITFYILSIFIGNPKLSEALNVYKPGIHIGLIVFGILYSPISLIIGLGMNILSRKNEFEADKYAASFNLGNELINALKKLTVKNYSNINPHPAYVFFHYSHPTLLQRILALIKFDKK